MLMKLKIKNLSSFILYLLFGIEVIKDTQNKGEIRIYVDVDEIFTRIILFVLTIDIVAVSIFCIMKLINNS